MKRPNPFTETRRWLEHIAKCVIVRNPQAREESYVSVINHPDHHLIDLSRAHKPVTIVGRNLRLRAPAHLCVPVVHIDMTERSTE